jgi:pimeloyl-ACP methyl ester carboxylesterase
MPLDLMAELQRGLRRYLLLRGVGAKVVQLDGYDTHYFDLRGHGRGPPLVLLHGLAGGSTGFFRLFFPLAKRFSRVLAPDLPGNGFSALPSGQAVGARAQLEVFSQFLDHVVGEPAFLVGSSLGGAMSILLAHHRPHALRALGLVSPAGGRASKERFEALYDSLEVKSLPQVRALTARLFHRPPLGAALVAQGIHRMYTAPSVVAALAEARAAPYLDPEVLASLRVPTLLLWGKSEKLLPYECIDYFRAHLPAQAQIEVVERFGHLPHVERPAELAQRLIRFADRAGL